MTNEELFRFDVRGYLVLEDVLDPDYLRQINQRMDLWERSTACGRLGLGPATPPPISGLADGDELGRFRDPRKATIDRIANFEPILGDMIDHPRVLPYVVEMVEQPRLKSTWLTIKWKGGRTDAHSMHTPSMTCNFYHFNRQFRANLLNAFYALKDIGPDEGALHVIPGTHKSNYALPEGANLRDMLVPIPLKAGSVLLLTHDLHHVSRNDSDKVRRTLIFTYCPLVIANSVGGDGLYDRMFAAAPEGSWRKYLLRRPHGFRETYPRPKLESIGKTSGSGK